MYFAVTTRLECDAAQRDEANLVGSGGCDFRVPNAHVPIEGLSDTRVIIWARADCVSSVIQAI